MSSPNVDLFLQRLEESRLLNDRRLQKIRAWARAEIVPEAITKRLIKRDYVTRWQARTLLAGKKGPFFLGNFRILKPLGQGGMGTVYKALQPGVRRVVALKVLSRRALTDERAVSRFQREIRAAAALDHPHITHAFDAGCLDDTDYLVMEYVRGRDLRQWITSAARLPLDWCCECIRQAALGLQYAHERGIVHRDIKPSNLLLVQKSATERPHVKIADFGLASAGLGIADEKGLTRIGQGLGTSEYVAPEQATDSTTADIRADIFSLGCTLFELLSGQLPFNGSNSFERLMARFKQNAPLVSSLRPDVPPDLDQVVARMMARDAALRYQTPADVAEALTPFCGTNLSAPIGVRIAPIGEPENSLTPFDSDSPLDHFLESLAGESSSRSLLSLPKLGVRNTLRGWILPATAAVAILLLIVVLSWTFAAME